MNPVAVGARGYAHYRGRSWWRPALVAFVSFGDSYDSNVCWYPLGYRQRDPRSNFYRRAVNRAIEQQRLANLNRVNPIYQRAVTTMQARQFGRLTARGQPATKELALRAVSTEPVRGGLGLRPVEADLRTPSDGRTPVVRERKGDALVIRNPTDPSRVLVERKTGASARKPGFALDEELRRGRIYNNREPRKIERVRDANSGGGIPAVNNERGNGKNSEGRISDDGERKTGAVARPVRPIRMPADGANADGGTMMKRPIVTSDDGERPERKVRPVQRPSDDATTPTPEVRRERPTVREERAKPVERERTAPEVYRPRPEVREERKTERRERPEPRYERPAPVREERPSPREERSAPREERSAPREERSAPPPQREERRPDPPRQRDDSPLRQKSKPSDND